VGAVHLTTEKDVFSEILKIASISKATGSSLEPGKLLSKYPSSPKAWSSKMATLARKKVKNSGLPVAGFPSPVVP